MATDLRLKESLPDLTDRIVETYENLNSINHLGHCSLPSYDVIVTNSDNQVFQATGLTCWNDPEVAPVQDGGLEGIMFSATSIKGNYLLDNVTLTGEPAGDLPGDLNGDGFVGGDDLDIIRSFWGRDVDERDLLSGDPSGDGFVGGDDLDIVRANWGLGTPPAPSAVPEPGSMAVILIGALALLAPRRR